MSFPRYPEYKDSGVEWLGVVPGHWNICALKRIADLKSGESITAEDIEEDGDFPVFGGNGLRGFTTRYTHEGTYALIGRQGALCGNINYATGKFWASEHAVVATPKVAVETHWLGELMRAMNLNQYSVSAAQPGLSVEIVGNLRIPVPPAPEQTAIATFLDRETAKIDALVAEQQKLIALLQEKRQAVISHAVTQGLNPNVTMKDTGVEWLGEVPEHWEVAQFRRHVYIAEGQIDPELPQFREMTLIAPNHVESGTGRVLLLETAEDQAAESGKYQCMTGDVIYSKIRPALRKVCFAPSDCLCSADMYPLRPKDGLTSKFLLWFMLSEQFSSLAVLESERVAMPKINRETLNGVMVVLPTVREQVEIDRFLTATTSKLDTLMTEARTAIALLQERRTALISAAVTGQIDVRGLVGSANAPDSIAASAYPANA